MRWGLVALLCVAACGGQGVDLEVDADVAFDRVELFVTYDTCHDKNGAACMQGVGWPGQTSRPPGSIFVLRDDEKLISTAMIVDNAAVIHLEAAAGFEDTKAIAIAAYQGGKVVAATILWDSRIPLHAAERWKVHLDSTDDASVKTHEDPGDKPYHRALAWPREASPEVPDPSGYAGCFVYQEWNGTQWDSSYFVPETDMDCDGTPPDCTPLWNHYNPQLARCVTKTTTTSFCVLGTPTCADETPGTTCMANTPTTCMPQQICTQCQDTSDLSSCLGMAVQGNAGTGLLTNAECLFSVDPNNQGPCADPLANKKVFQILGTCPNANPVLRDPMMPFSGGNASVTTADGATFVVSAQSDVTSCTLTLEYKSGIATMNHYFVLAFTMPLRQVLVPLTIGIEATTVCPTMTTEPGMCTVRGPGLQDSLFQCIRAN